MPDEHKTESCKPTWLWDQKQTIKSLKTTINDSKIFRERLITYFVAIHQSVLHVYICEIITKHVLFIFFLNMFMSNM